MVRKRYRQIRRKMRKKQPLHYRLVLGWMLLLVAFTPWMLAVVVGMLVIGAAIFAAARPGRRAQIYYKILAITSLSLTTFVDSMLLLGGY